MQMHGSFEGISPENACLVWVLVSYHDPCSLEVKLFHIRRCAFAGKAKLPTSILQGHKGPYNTCGTRILWDTPPKTDMTGWKIHNLKMYFLLKMVIFQCHSLVFRGVPS